MQVQYFNDVISVFRHISFLGIDSHDIDTKLPLAEVITLSGFFAVCIMEELLHHFLHPHEPVQDCDTFMDNETGRQGGKHESKLKSVVRSTFKTKPNPPNVVPTTNVNGIHLNEFLRYDRRLRSDSDSPPPSYTSEESDSGVKSSEPNGYDGLKSQVAAPKSGG